MTPFNLKDYEVMTEDIEGPQHVTEAEAQTAMQPHLREQNGLATGDAVVGVQGSSSEFLAVPSQQYANMAPAQYQNIGQDVSYPSVEHDDATIPYAYAPAPGLAACAHNTPAPATAVGAEDDSSPPDREQSPVNFDDVSSWIDTAPAEVFSIAITKDDTLYKKWSGIDPLALVRGLPPTDGTLLAAQAISTIWTETVDIPTTILRMGITHEHGNRLRLRGMKYETWKRTFDAIGGEGDGQQSLKMEELWDALDQWALHSMEIIGAQRAKWEEAQALIKRADELEVTEKAHGMGKGNAAEACEDAEAMSLADENTRTPQGKRKREFADDVEVVPATPKKKGFFW